MPRVSQAGDPVTELRTTLHKAVEYCDANDWAGYDPYDALNSRVFAKMTFLQSRVPRIALTQLLKRSPVNLRRLLDVPKTQNPKALSLFLSAFAKLASAGNTDYERYCGYLVHRLEALRSSEQGYWCWGYSFPWQTRREVVHNRIVAIARRDFHQFESWRGHGLLSISAIAISGVMPR